jgi:hypothetical protein
MPFNTACSTRIPEIFLLLVHVPRCLWLLQPRRPPPMIVTGPPQAPHRSSPDSRRRGSGSYSVGPRACHQGGDEPDTTCRPILSAVPAYQQRSILLMGYAQPPQQAEVLAGRVGRTQPRTESNRGDCAGAPKWRICLASASSNPYVTAVYQILDLVAFSFGSLLKA